MQRARLTLIGPAGYGSPLLRGATYERAFDGRVALCAAKSGDAESVKQFAEKMGAPSPAAPRPGIVRVTIRRRAKTAQIISLR